MTHSMISGARRLPLHHVTIRVPWHDANWNGSVCSRPTDNTSCLALSRIAEEKDDARECLVAGRALAELRPAELPPCVEERVTILSPKSLLTRKRHPYVELSPNTHGHILETPLEFPAHGASCVPFGWMLRQMAEVRAQELQLGFQPEREPRLDWFKKDDEVSTWIQEHDNQRVFLDTFFGAVQPEESLCFFYAKRTPLSEGAGRTLVGVGRVKKVGQPLEYEYAKGSKGKMRSAFWERSLFHSIRPDFADGFLLPYQEILALADAAASIRPEDYVAMAPNELFDSFSYGSELLSHDGAIASLLALHSALGKVGNLVEGPWGACQKWIDTELNRLWKARGPFPGIGSALRALGLERGTLIAYEVAKAQADSKREHSENPWELIDQLVDTPELLPDDLGSELGKTWRKTWKKLTKERRALLELLSRFSLSAAQAEYFYVSSLREESGIEATDRELLENPYLLYELSRGWPDPVPFGVLDRGMFPDPVVTERFPIPEPSRLEDAIDPRRVRAAMVHVLESAAGEGHTLLPQNWVIQRVRGLGVQPELPLSEDVLPVVEPELGEVVHLVELDDGSRGYQLARFGETRDVIANEVTRRTGSRAKPHVAKADWATLVAKGIDEKLPEAGPEREAEERAREEKSEALKMIFASRLSVLIGPAGTGKTTLLKTLCDMPQVKSDGILLLAPTGKARVRLETATKQRGNGKTIAQFLNKLHRYEGDAGTYLVNPGATHESGYGTVIIDECSMLTEEQLAAVFDALQKVKRYVLVGDPRQLPPIGAGRPFVDIVRSLAPENVETTFPRVGPGYAELTIHRRQKGETRDDLLLASWFAGGASDPSADAVWSRIEAESSPHLKVIEWTHGPDLEAKLLGALVDGLDQLSSDEDEVGFEETLGGNRFKDSPHAFFNNAYKDRAGAGAFAERWQILSPVRASEVGVDALNRGIQSRFRTAVRKLATTTSWRKKVPKPFGTQQLLYGDKVINVQNKNRSKDVYPKPEGEAYVANGDIGIIVGQYKGQKASYKRNPWKLEVEFASQVGTKYGYSDWEFGEEKNPPLELAYALTVHKSQGSEFDLTFIVLPNPCWLLSRELLYTALTRHRDRIVILHQGSIREMRRFSGEGYSDIARRVTNLFDAPNPVEVFVADKKVFLEKGLIHRTEAGGLVRSKSELVIADKLHGRKIEYVYEQELRLDDGQVWYPDFAIEDATTGETYYWEHLGLLHVPQYRQRWQHKLASYRKNGILPHTEGGGEHGTLITTRDDPGGGLDAAAIAKLIDEVFG